MQFTLNDPAALGAMARSLRPMQAALFRQLPTRSHAGIGADWAAIRTTHAMRRAQQLQAAGLVETDTTPPIMGRRIGAGFARLTPRGLAVRAEMGGVA